MSLAGQGLDGGLDSLVTPAGLLHFHAVGSGRVSDAARPD
jgi:hypothetical protein